MRAVATSPRAYPSAPGAARMTTFITGASGFVGLALAEHLLARGEHVVGFDLAPPRPAAASACSPSEPMPSSLVIWMRIRRP